MYTQYLARLGGRKSVDVSEMATALQRRYTEYSRRRKNAFKSLVARGELLLRVF